MNGFSSSLVISFHLLARLMHRMKTFPSKVLLNFSWEYLVVLTVWDEKKKDRLEEGQDMVDGASLETRRLLHVT